ncbi:unnamed protein product [Protopolystoma xenopodis]|uniref:ATPase AAA-type core domain-containing protein n=1 Tax=Protopolystoma xenopodis TaxID=117903 RepID=A0A3S5BA40_9PLAT|nr:unnamed protein product [Protopolystoma xenopodis]
MVASGSERVLVLTATNRPQELDNAALRRFSRRVFIGMPDETMRLSLLQSLLKDQPKCQRLDKDDLITISR